MERLLGKVAIVTGGGSGIGKGIAQMYAKEGAHVIIADINPNAEEVANQINNDHGSALFVEADVSKANDAKRIVEMSLDKFGKVDILVNNAGKELSKPLLATEEWEWDDIIAVNLKSIYLMSRIVVKHFVGKGGGVIINMGSITAKNGFRNYPAYTATKGAIHALTRQMAMELAEFHIRINTIYPGTIDTPLSMRNFIATSDDVEKAIKDSIDQHLIGRLGKPEDIGYAAVYLASDESAFVTGQEFGIDGGYTIRGT
ncbi:SDR family NAD(P)-dependent oxidoreductase [Lederbergia citrea]|uniref:SDR family NAD(P)-dependent oxidoreductase n=1 Tax=Lederbergia citrea TaxID=2833581 RepID=UPI001BC900AB|nr:SDR family oxidoreductase [Lederbergia citrea]MBS4178795.1 SDR family oxidoreductase [Lederbergia citrea]